MAASWPHELTLTLPEPLAMMFFLFFSLIFYSVVVVLWWIKKKYIIFINRVVTLYQSTQRKRNCLETIVALEGNKLCIDIFSFLIVWYLKH
jgi:hypothetical protein